MKKPLVFFVIAVLFFGAGLILYKNLFSQDQTESKSSSSNSMDKKSSDSSINNSQSLDKNKYSIDDPTSIWVVVNKSRPISTSFVPSNLAIADVTNDPNDSLQEKQIRSDVAPAVKQMFEDANKQGFRLLFASGYRSAKFQETLFKNYSARDGVAAANKYSAKPGQSEHQTGLAFDVAREDRKCYIDICFADTPEGKWLAGNSYKYGFTLRYKKGKESITGYQFEPWHFRYVGVELATELNKNNQTLEEFFGL